MSHVDIPFEIICSGNTECNDACVKQIDDYYNKITLCILHACDNVIPKRKNLLDTDYYTVAGWNEHVKDQYDIIDLAVTALFRSHLKKMMMMKFLEQLIWTGYTWANHIMDLTFWWMRVALWYSKQHEIALLLLLLLYLWSVKIYNKFWKGVKKVNNGNVSKFAT